MSEAEQGRVVEFAIGGMTCASCSGRVERALGKVPCGVAWDQSRFRPRTAWESTAGDPVTLKACVSPTPSWRDGARRPPGTRRPAS